MIRICAGCGAKIQSTDKTKEGYVPENKEDALYCERCFKIIHYNINFESNTPKEINDILSKINGDYKFVIFLVDFLNIKRDIIDIFKRIKNNKMLLISKCDIIPKEIKYSSVENFLRDEYKIDDSIKFISNFKNYGVDALINYLKNNNIKDVYIIGESNSGKSTLINKILEIKESSLNKLATSNHPNTTLDFLKLEIDDDLTIIDTPGFILPSINIEVLNKKINLSGYIKPITYQMKKGEVLRIESFFLKFSGATSITLYMSNDIYSKKYFKEVNFSSKLDISDNTDLIIPGLGFIHIKNACILYLSNLDIMILDVRPSIFGRLK